MTTKEVKLVTYLIHHFIASQSLGKDKTTPITELFLRELVSKKIKQIIDEPVKDRLRSIYNEVQSNNFVNEKAMVSNDDFLKTMNQILKNTLQDG